MIRNGAMTFGTMCRRMMRDAPKPQARAASTYGTSRITSAAERTTRAQRGISGMVMAMMTLCTPVPKIDTMASVPG